MTTEEIDALIKKINTNPCKEGDLNRSLTIISQSLTQINNNIRKGTWLGEVRAVVVNNNCEGFESTTDAEFVTVDPDTFVLYGDDEDEEISAPSTVKNSFSYLIQNADLLLIAFVPSGDGNGEWRLCVPTHKTRSAILDITRSGQTVLTATKEVKFSVAGGYCPTETVLLSTTTAQAVRSVRLDTSSSSCDVKVTYVTLEVFSSSVGAEETAWSHQAVSVVNDVYRVGNSVYTFSYMVWVPCVGIDGSRFRFNVCCPPDTVISAGGEGCCCLPDTFTGTISNAVCNGSPGMPASVTMTGNCNSLAWSSNTFRHPCADESSSFPPTAGMSLSCANPDGWVLRGSGFTVEAELTEIDCTNDIIEFHVEFNANGCVGSFDIRFQP